MDSDARTSLVIKVEPVVPRLSSGSSDQDEREETSSSEVKFHSLEQDEGLNSSSATPSASERPANSLLSIPDTKGGIFGNLSQKFFCGGFRIEIPNWIPCKHPHTKSSPPEIRKKILAFFVVLRFLCQAKISDLCHKFNTPNANNTSKMYSDFNSQWT